MPWSYDSSVLRVGLNDDCVERAEPTRAPMHFATAVRLIPESNGHEKLPL